jgi:integrase
MASIRKRTWVDRHGEKHQAYVLDYKDQFGGRHQPQFDRKKDAEAERRRVEEEVRKGTHTADRDTWTLSKACQAYIDHITEQHRLFGKPSGYMVKSYSGAARRHIIPKFTGLKLNTPRIWLPLQQFLDDTAKADKASPHGEVKHDKLSVLKIVINQTIKFAVAQGRLHANPLRDHWLKLPERDKRQIEIPTKEEAHRFTAALQNRPKKMHEITYRNAVVIMNLAMYTPMREGEICALWWENIDWELDEINITHSESDIDGRKPTKTPAGHRKNPLLPPLRAVLLEHAATRGCELTGYVLVNEEGNPVQPSDVAGVHWPGIAKEAGLLRMSKRQSDGALYQGRTPKYHFHALRHFGAALLIEQGCDPYHLMKFMGHKDIRVTYNTYGHLFPSDQSVRDKMIAGLESFILPRLPDLSTKVSLTSRDEDGRAKVAELRAKGMKRNKIAAALGVPPWQVSRWDVRGAGKERLAERDKQILALRSEGKSLQAIAQIFDMTIAGIHGRLIVHGDPWQENPLAHIPAQSAAGRAGALKSAVEERDGKIAEMEANGTTVTKIALAVGIDRVSVHRRFNRMHLSESRNAIRKQEQADRDAKLLEMRAQRIPVTKIALAVGMRRESVWRRLKQLQPDAGCSTDAAQALAVTLDPPETAVFDE